MAEKLTIFISGTMRDLPTERARVAAAIRDMGLEPVWAEERGATNRLSYGWKFRPEETISATEFEGRRQRASKPMPIYGQKGQP